jgi:hypothetical protein
MDDSTIKLAIGHLQRAMRELNGYAPPREADFIDYHPDNEPHYKLFEAVDFYAHAAAQTISEDSGRIARETLAEIRRLTT